MVVRKRGFRVFALLCALCASLLFLYSNVPSAITEETVTSVITVTEVTTSMGENTVSYPQLEGMPDVQMQQVINDAIVEKAKIAQRIVTLSTLQSGGTGLTVGYEAYLGSTIFSTVISAQGILENGRAGQSYTALAFDLATGRALTLSDLFIDVEAAVAYMETVLTDTYLDELSSYLENAELTPLPQDSFMLDADGITFYYPAKQFSLLSGYCGAAQFNYDELSDYLLTDADALPARLGVLPVTLSDAEIRTKIEQTVTAGELPHVKAKLGDSMTGLVQQYRLLRQPDQYPGGRYFQMEAPAFRQVLVLTDALTSGWENSVVNGLMSFREDLYGIRTGVTQRDRWLQVLGDPESTVAFGEDLAYDYGLPIGTADYYTIGNRQLLLYADENDVLYAVRLTE
ncbi:MAG: RsiV family protein [Eubacteriales bacterium]|nr:RsiV family protein [Eubacteriales bacterium]